ncbi:MAG: oligosaccharide flippase family protein [Oscillospiraceae bacterium]|nr:oligosaccharide flippase family protein [Oscillospiraceae bacterium]
MPSIKKNFIYQSAYRLLLVLVPFILTPYISRVFGAEGIGVLAFTSSTVMYFVLFAMLGIGHHGTRVIASVRDDSAKLNKAFSNLVVLHMLISLLVIFFYAVFIVFFAQEYRFLFLIQSPILLSALLDITWFFAGLENFKLVTVRNAIVKVGSVICVFIFVNDRTDIWIYALIMALSMLLGQASVWFLLRRFVKLVKPSWSEMKPHLKPMLVLFVPIIAMSVYNVMNKILLGAFSDNTELGYFDNSLKLIALPMGITVALNSVMISRISNINAMGNEAGKNKLTLYSMKYFMLFAYAISFGIAAIARDFAPIFFGPEFEDLGILIMVLTISIPFAIFGNTVISQYILPHSKDNIYLYAAIIAAVLSLVANLILIPYYGAMGAVAGFIVAETTRCVISAVASKNALPIWTYVKNSLFFMVPGAMMFLLVRFISGLLERSVLSVIMQICIGGIFYLGISAIYLYKTKDEVFFGWISKTG